MGFNISGLVINKNYSDKLSELESILGEKLRFEKEVLYEDCLESWKEDDYCDIYFSENGTLIFMAMERGGFAFKIPNKNAFSFVLSEMTMVFCLNYTENGKSIRTIVETEGEISENEGEPLDIEENEDDKSELIYLLIEEVLGESFHEIDLEAKCLRFYYDGKKEENDTTEEKTSVTIEKNKPQTVKNTTKPWWKFW